MVRPSEAMLHRSAMGCPRLRPRLKKKNVVERILSYQTFKYSDFLIFIPPGNLILKSEKAQKCVKNDPFEMKFSIKVSLKIFCASDTTNVGM